MEKRTVSDKCLNKMVCTLIVILVVFIFLLFLFLPNGYYMDRRLQFIGLYYVIPVLLCLLIFSILYFKVKMRQLVASEMIKEKEMECKIRWEDALLRLDKERADLEYIRQQREMELGLTRQQREMDLDFDKKQREFELQIKKDAYEMDKKKKEEKQSEEDKKGDTERKEDN